jgi:hypothetical protein
MRVCFLQHEIELLRWGNEGERDEYLSQCEAGRLMLGEDSEGQSSLYSVTVHRGNTGQRLGIGVRAEAHGLTPTLLLNESTGDLWIGFNRTVVSVDLELAVVRFSIRLESLFHRFISVAGRVLVLHETGVWALTTTGGTIWRHTTDLIENWDLRGEQLFLYLLDEPSVRISVSSGTCTRFAREDGPPTSSGAG